MYLAAPFITTKTWTRSQCPWTDGWIKIWYIYTVEYYSAINMNEIMPFAAIWMDLDFNILSGLSQAAKGKYRTISLTHGMETLKLICKTETTHRNTFWLPKWKWVGEG